MIHAFGSKENEYWVKKTPLHSKSNDVPILSLRKKQNFLGLGGAITKSSAYNYNLLDEENKKELINLYFSKNGLDYDLARISIGSNDFSPYVYDDMDEKGNINIKNEEDVCLILDEIKKIKKVTTLGSSWSPLTIWKDNGNKNNGGKLLEKCVDSCASYYVSVIKEFAKRGHPIDYFSPQNEPEARQVWESCLMDEKEEGMLALAIKRIDHSINILLWDHNRDVILRRCNNYIKVPSLIDNVSGFAYHWYDRDKNQELEMVKTLFPDKIILQTEACVELLFEKEGERTNKMNHSSFLRYYEDHILDANYGSNGFVDWNILLDDMGGPNHVGNFCGSPIMRNGSKLVLNPPYFALKHLSKVIKNGSRMVECNKLDGLLLLSSIDSNGKYSLTALNKRDSGITLRIEKFNKSIHMDKEETITIWEE